MIKIWTLPLGWILEYSLWIVHLLAVVVSKVVNNNRDGEGHDLEMDEEGIDDNRTRFWELGAAKVAIPSDSYDT